MKLSLRSYIESKKHGIKYSDLETEEKDSYNQNVDLLKLGLDEVMDRVSTLEKEVHELNVKLDIALKLLKK